MDFEELKDQPQAANMKKNRMTLIALFAMFIAPVAIAYVAYFNGWFAAASKNNGELLTRESVLDIEDFKFERADGSMITGKEFETLYWWLIPVDPLGCNSACLQLNIYTVNQTYLGLGKEAKRLNPLLVLPYGSQANLENFPMAFSEFSHVGVKALAESKSGLNKDLPANFIYLVDPLGNIILRYPLVEEEAQAARKSRELREDLLRLFKYSRLG